MSDNCHEAGSSESSVKHFRLNLNLLRKEFKRRNVLEGSCYKDAGTGERAEGMVRQPKGAHQQEASTWAGGTEGESRSQAAWRGHNHSECCQAGAGAWERA